MKILMVSIPNHHFFQWVNQLKTSGHEVYWFDVTDGGGFSEKIGWTIQCNGWKLRWDYPLRQRIKKQLPKLYRWLQHYNEVPVATAFSKTYQQIQPDIVHCFEMQLSGLPILPVMQANTTPLMYSSWGSDMFDFEHLGVSKNQAQAFLQRVDYLITDCQRDFKIATTLGFTNTFLGVYPGNGGLTIETSHIMPVNNRPLLMIKGYDDGVGQAIKVLQAIEALEPELFKEKSIIIYSADRVVEAYVKQSEPLASLNVKTLSRHHFVKNEQLLEFMGQSCLHIANSTSDGMPNALLEAMGMGAFPIQSNPGQVTEEVITHAKNGLLIQDPLAVEELSTLIKSALLDENLRAKAQEYNVNFIKTNYNRFTLQPKIVGLYQDVLRPQE